MKIKPNKTLNNEVEDKTTFFYHMFRNILLVCLPLVLISALLLSLPHSSAEGDSNRVDRLTLNLSVSCTISASELTPHTAVFEGSGLHREDIGTTKIGAFCNDNNGYNIYAIGYSNNTDGNTDLVSNLMDDYNIHTGIYSSGNTTSSWGMKVTAGTGTGINPDTGASVITTPPTIINGYNNYNVVPNVYTKVASRTSSTNMNTDIDVDVTGSYFTTTYDIYANSAQPAGTYIGQVKYILTHPSTNAPNTINSIDAAFALAGKQKVYQDENGSYYAMQDMSTDICNSVTTTGASTSSQLVDIRDHNIYWVTKEKDNHCWMTQNLDLDINGANTSPLNSNNTDISTDPTVSGVGIYSTSYGYNLSDGVWTWDPGTTTANITVNFATNKAEGWDSQNSLPRSADGGDTYYYAPDTTGAETRFDSLDACTDASHTASDCKHYHVGNYYNYTAAVASNNSGSLSTNYDNAGNSICPKNWRLPVAINSEQTTYEFGQLFFDSGITTGVSSTSYAGNGLKNIRKSPLWFVRSGRLYNGTLIDASYGFYWSSTVASVYNAYYLYFGSSGVWPAYSLGRDRGYSIRCIAQ